jgi:hypothetical protein
VLELILRDGRRFAVDAKILDRLQDDLFIYGSLFTAERGISRLDGAAEAALALHHAGRRRPVAFQGEASNAVERLLTGYGLTPTPEPVRQASLQVRSSVRCYGLYQGRIGREWLYLRFYADGTVMHLTSDLHAENAGRLLHRHADAASRGSWTLQGENLALELRDGQWVGRVHDNELILSPAQGDDRQELEFEYLPVKN